MQALMSYNLEKLLLGLSLTTLWAEAKKVKRYATHRERGLSLSEWQISREVSFLFHSMVVAIFFIAAAVERFLFPEPIMWQQARD